MLRFVPTLLLFILFMLVNIMSFPFEMAIRFIKVLSGHEEE